MHLFVAPQTVTFQPVAVSWTENKALKVAIFRDDHEAFTFFHGNNLADHDGQCWSEDGTPMAAPAKS